MERVYKTLDHVKKYCVSIYEHTLRHKHKVGVSVFLFIFIVSTLYALFIHHPSNAPTKYTFSIPGGATISSVAVSLKKEGIIKSPTIFKVLAILTQSDSGLFAGDYYFSEGENVFEVARRTTNGDFGLTPLSIFIPEGSTIYDIAEILEDRFTKFRGEKFIELAIKQEAEGYLFPDTYQFLPNVNEKKVFEIMNDNFNTKIESISELVESSEVPLEDIIIMASIIERESANIFEERRLISGILWNRIDIGMALQVDAVFEYINGKNTFELSTEDLAIDSPYNTYTNRGLPIGPIANPGLDSIIAALDPEPSNYLFYLHDLNGNAHYSIDFEGHKANKFRYLR